MMGKYRVFTIVSRPGERDVSATWDILYKLAELSRYKESFRKYPCLELVKSEEVQTHELPR